MSARLKAVEPRRDLRSAPALRRPKKDEPSYAYRDELPFFVNRRSAKNAWWNVMPSGDYFADYKTGEEYAAAFWRVCGGRPTCGLDLGQILFAMHDPGRQRSDRYDGLSGIEVGFIRTIGQIVDIAVGVPVMVNQSRTGLRRRMGRITNKKVRASAKVTQVILEALHASDRKRAEKRDAVRA